MISKNSTGRIFLFRGLIFFLKILIGYVTTGKIFRILYGHRLLPDHTSKSDNTKNNLKMTQTMLFIGDFKQFYRSYFFLFGTLIIVLNILIGCVDSGKIFIMFYDHRLFPARTSKFFVENHHFRRNF